MGPKLPNKPIHRNSLGRRVSKLILDDNTTIERFYFEDKEKFREAFSCYNKLAQSESNDHLKYKCIGYVNCKMRFCTRCQDIGKEQKTEKYFISTPSTQEQVKKKIICYGCMGCLIKSYA